MEKSFLNDESKNEPFRAPEADYTELEDVDAGPEIELDEAECMDLNDNFFDVALGRVDADSARLKIEISERHFTGVPDRRLYEREDHDTFIRPLNSLTSNPSKILSSLAVEPEIEIENDVEVENDEDYYEPAPIKRGKNNAREKGTRRYNKRRGVCFCAKLMFILGGRNRV